MRSVIMILLLVSFCAGAGTLERELRDIADYGGGSYALNHYTAGGVPSIGLVAGHANSCPIRMDRFAMKFNIGALYLLRNPNIKSANLVLPIKKVWNADKITRIISLWGFNNEPLRLTSSTLADTDVVLVGKLENDKPVLVFDITEAVRRAYTKKFGCVAFRVTDSAEETSNTTRYPRSTVFTCASKGDKEVPKIIINYN
ncbi:MAG: hypothetical protein WCQ87_11600 [Parabacteroides sp.]